MQMPLEGAGGVPVGQFPNANLIEDYLKILPDVFAFRVPEQNRRSQYVCCRNMWEVGPDGKIIADRFEDDISLAVKGEMGWSLLLGCSTCGTAEHYAESQRLVWHRTSSHGCRRLSPLWCQSRGLRRLV